MQTAQAAIARLCDPAAGVSAHYVICRTGQVSQLVSEGLRAWHAGAGGWAGLDDMNSRSIGIELDNDGHSAFPEAQMHSLETLLDSILTGWSIPPAHVIGHSDMAPGRKVDPGPLFDWARLERGGRAAKRGTADGPEEASMAAFVDLARQAGYTAPVTADALLDAVRLRYFGDKSGPLDPEDFVPLQPKHR